ncbi:MAG TPA: hypothetical protein PK349_11580 [Candidatus Hydrogenedentes bacterium]|nr:hypothetical protein [Candidatus Hydrogenedentota bacterium]
MLGEFAQIVDEIVRGAEALEKALTQGREQLAQIAQQLQAQSQIAAIPSAGRPDLRRGQAESTIVNLDRFRELNARQLSEALRSAVGAKPITSQKEQLQQETTAALLPPRTETAAAGSLVRELIGKEANPGLVEQLTKLNPSAEKIARHLEKAERSAIQPAPMSRSPIARQRLRRLRGPQRRAAGLASKLQDLLWTRRGRVWRWRLERSRSPLRQYVGRALTQFAERGNVRQLATTLQRAPTVMRSPQAIQAARAAGISLTALARGANVVGAIGQAGGAVAGVASALTGPIGVVLAFGTALAAALVSLVRWARGLEQTVLTIQQTAESFRYVHSGMAGLAAQLQAARLQEQRRVAEGTYQSTRLYAAMAERYRREGEQLRILGANLGNLAGMAKLVAGEMIKVATGLKLLEQAAGPLNRGLDAVLKTIEKHVGINLEGKSPADWWFHYLERMRDARVAMVPRRKPDEPFNKRPKK